MTDYTSNGGAAPAEDPAGELVTRLVRRRQFPDAAERRRIREASGASLQEVADVLGVTISSVGRWETGGRLPTRKHLDQYLDLLDKMREIPHKERT